MIPTRPSQPGGVRPPSPRRLLLMLVLVLIFIWWLVQGG